MDEASGQVADDEQIAEAMAAGHQSLSLECRAEAARLERLLAPDFHEFGASAGRAPAKWRDVRLMPSWPVRRVRE